MYFLKSKNPRSKTTHTKVFETPGEFLFSLLKQKKQKPLQSYTYGKQDGRTNPVSTR